RPSRPDTPNVIESLSAGACEAAQAAELTPVAMPVLKGPGRTTRRRQLPLLSEPTSWHDRNRAEPDPTRAASHPEGMTATAPESAGICSPLSRRGIGGQSMVVAAGGRC